MYIYIYKLTDTSRPSDARTEIESPARFPAGSEMAITVGSSASAGTATAVTVVGEWAA